MVAGEACRLWHDMTRQDRVAVALAAIFLFILPIPHTVSLRLIALFLSATLVVFGTTRKDWSLLPLKGPWIVWLAIQLLSLTTAVSPLFTLGAIKAETLYSFVAYVLFFFLCRKKQVARLLMVLPIGALVLLAAGGWAEWNVTGMAVGPTTIYDGVGKFTTYVITIIPLMSIILAAKETKLRTRVAMIIVALFGCMTAYLGSNRMFWLALAVEIVTLLIFLLPRQPEGRARIWLYGVGGGAVLLVGIATVFYNVLQLRTGTRLDGFSEVVTTTIMKDPRWPLWAFCVHKIWDHPLYGVGFGLGAFALAYPQWLRRAPDLWHAHNIFLNYGIEMGVPGIVAFLWLIWSILKVIRPIYRTPGTDDRHLAAIALLTMILGVLAKNMTDDFFYQDLALLFWSITGGILGYISRAGASHESTGISVPRGMGTERSSCG